MNPASSIQQPASLLVIKPSSLGDVVHTLPAVAALKRQWPAARLTWLVNPEWAPLLAGNPHVDEVAIFPRGEFRGLRGWTKIPRWAQEFAAQKSALVVDFQGLLRSALIARLARGGEIAGLSDAREGARFFYDLVAPVQGIAHAVDRYLRLAQAVGATIPPQLEWPLPAGRPLGSFSASEPFVLLHPFSRGAGKSLTSAQVGEACAALAPRRIVIVGRADARIETATNTIDLLNRTTLDELIWLIRRADFVISVDSGPLHIAAALTPRLLAIHTWSDPARVGPYNKDAWIWNSRAFFRVGEIGDPDAHRPCSTAGEACRLFQQQLAR